MKFIYATRLGDDKTVAIHRDSITSIYPSGKIEGAPIVINFDNGRFIAVTESFETIMQRLETSYLMYKH
jgi:hypothetical protein